MSHGDHKDFLVLMIQCMVYAVGASAGGALLARSKIELEAAGGRRYDPRGMGKHHA